MSVGRISDLLETLEVLQGRRDSVENQKTWLRHGAKSQAGQIDLLLLQGASVGEIARQIPCREKRVQDHFHHLENGPSTMEPHHLILRNINGSWSFDRDWLERQFRNDR
jgi:hypothetical protein